MLYSIIILIVYQNFLLGAPEIQAGFMPVLILLQAQGGPNKKLITFINFDILNIWLQVKTLWFSFMTK